MNKMLYFIPVFGLVLMAFRPYETDSIIFVTIFVFWQIISSFLITFPILVSTL